MIVTIFRSRVRPEVEQEYSEWARRMSQLAAAMPGYISHKGYTAQDGERLTLVEFESEQALQAWARHPEHVAAKRKGRTDFYSEYQVRICTPLRESVFARPVSDESPTIPV